MGTKRIPDAPVLLKLMISAFFDQMKGKFKNERLTQEAALVNFLSLFKSQ
jgi:hypothetical protein